MKSRASGIVAALAMSIALDSCASPGVSPANFRVAGAAPAPTPAIVGDDWVTFAHDDLRTGSETQNTGLSAQTVSQLTLRWKFAAPDGIYASPLVYGGLVIVATSNQGVVYALDAKAGNVVWQRSLGGQIRMTPAIDNGEVFVGTHLFTVAGPNTYLPAPSTFYALDLLTGAVRWEVPITGTGRSSPVTGSGKVFVGIAGGDLPKCFQGGVEALDEASGAALWFWHVNPRPNQGGAIWAPLSYDGTRIIVGTGNTCNPTPLTTANGVVALDAQTGALDWSFVAYRNSFFDDDTGGGTLVNGSHVYVINKNGLFYDLDRGSGRLHFSKPLNPTDAQGGWATPTTDGATLLMSGGSYTAASPELSTRTFFSDRRRGLDNASGQTGKLFAMDMSGNVVWTLTSQTPIVSYAAISGGMAFVNVDNQIIALNLATGAQLWSYTLTNLADGGPVVTTSGVYTADDSGNVYAFSLP